ncbi:hypothetical protein EMIHUDRAFT_442015 [Emiliania huxleyi CCMP1516]|uniref:Methyltransferase type 11 domain-containing protein n=2 Tax=Emiliania huxleyi TaxID=2903 RepID=A0A0D3K987_EMIH1|nr:hypothetical protein EMIHUDRAFT_442015 [Emiliania huxleyi CCMP1516]EOD32322.1 hypothetical protein EMIHUDRAFT_442015 [Emiliania huxleyi CCMP1516]|eukprot:XP_005784751.1 hypothetical protein EMIHUDRAFT_442015 [Emiliania huxleyi CCMP1516]
MALSAALLSAALSLAPGPEGRPKAPRPLPQNSLLPAKPLPLLPSLPPRNGACDGDFETFLREEQTRAATFLESEQTRVARIFEWEHDRALRFERLGEHANYWEDPRIHNFGNTGWRGWLHALAVPFSTFLIDKLAYGGVDARKQIHESELSAAGQTVVDLCSGVGFSCARAGKVTAVDTSPNMLAVSRLRRPDVHERVVANAEAFGEAGSFDVATLMFATHEMPGYARRRCIRNALRLARDKVLVADIWPGFRPNDMMLSGEPYVLDYLANMESDVEASFDPMQWTLTREDVVEQHVRMWKFERLSWGV